MSSPIFTAPTCKRVTTPNGQRRGTGHLTLVSGAVGREESGDARRMSPDHPAVRYLAERSHAQAHSGHVDPELQQTEPESPNWGTSSRGRGHHDNEGPVHSGSGPHSEPLQVRPFMERPAGGPRSRRLRIVEPATNAQASPETRTEPSVPSPQPIDQQPFEQMKAAYVERLETYISSLHSRPSPSPSPQHKP